VCLSLIFLHSITNKILKISRYFHFSLSLSTATTATTKTRPPLFAVACSSFPLLLLGKSHKIDRDLLLLSFNLVLLIEVYFLSLCLDSKILTKIPHGIGANWQSKVDTEEHFQVSTISMESQLALIEKSFNTRYSPWVREALEELPHNFTITDPTISGHPIVFASPGFLKMSGFRRDQVIGNNGRMFQGPKTNRKTVMEIREAIREERAVQVSLWNYRKDGTPFWMLFQMSPVFSKEDGRVIHFIGVQVPILRNKRSTDDGADAAWNEIVFGSCRREVCSDSLVELGRVLALDTYTNCRGLFLCNCFTLSYHCIASSSNFLGAHFSFLR